MSIAKGVFLSVPGRENNSKSQENLINRECTDLNLHYKPNPCLAYFSWNTVNNWPLLQPFLSLAKDGVLTGDLGHRIYSFRDMSTFLHPNFPTFSVGCFLDSEAFL